jgi:hypothetical protein
MARPNLKMHTKSVPSEEVAVVPSSSRVSLEAEQPRHHQGGDERHHARSLSLALRQRVTITAAGFFFFAGMLEFATQPGKDESRTVSCGRRTRGDAHGSVRQQWLASDRHSSLRRRRHAPSDRPRGRALQSPQPVQTYRVRLEKFHQRNAPGGHAGEVEAVQCAGPAANAMTPADCVLTPRSQ